MIYCYMIKVHSFIGLQQIVSELLLSFIINGLDCIHRPDVDCLVKYNIHITNEWTIVNYDKHLTIKQCQVCVYVPNNNEEGCTIIVYM